MEAEYQTQQKNQVLSGDYRPSTNFYRSDRILQHLLWRLLSQEGLSFLQDYLHFTGEQAAGPMNALSLAADKNGPTLVKRNWLGEDIDEIHFHPAYEALTRIAVDSGMFYVKWAPELRQRFGEERHRMGFGPGFLYAMSESGLYCPLCMTDGAARLIDRYCTDSDRERLLPRIYTQDHRQLYTGAMFLTEKAGGSDVGANLVMATPNRDGYYRLTGEKWFCSNANAEIIFALARTENSRPGTRGLSIFLIEPNLPDGRRNPMHIVRLKDKLGVRSMASAEILLQKTLGKRVGDEGNGFRIMTDMINLSRLYNAVAATAAMRRALVEAYQFLTYRRTFGKSALEHALIRDKLTEIGARSLAETYLTWRTIETLDQADGGDETARHRLRLLTPMVKKSSAETGVYVIRECMELMGGMGYIEDGVLPKLMRDAMVLPIWEGAGNIIVLDMLRATQKSDGLDAIIKDIRQMLTAADQKDRHFFVSLLQNIKSLIAQLPDQEREVSESTAAPLFGYLTRIYQIALMYHYSDDTSRVWTEPAIRFLTGTLRPAALNMRRPNSRAIVESLMGWTMP